MFLLALEALGVRSDTDVRDACSCKKWDKCNWANDMVYEISDIPRGDPLWMKRVKFFKARICDRKTKSVYCCDEEKPPNDRLVKILRDPSLFKQEEEVKWFKLNSFPGDSSKSWNTISVPILILCGN